MEKVLISACLAGENCKYDGGNNLMKRLNELSSLCDLILVCPEQFGGMKTPRQPSEILGNKVISKKGSDVTMFFRNGASMVSFIAMQHQVKYALMKENSPSCGNKHVYDGTFSNNIIKGKGITVQELEKIGVQVFNEKEIDDLISILKNGN